MTRDGQRFTGRRFVFLSFITLLFVSYTSQVFAAPAEWTFLIYLNGNNSLDSFGTDNMKMMEKVGSTKDINIVVEWASESAKNTRRILVQKGTSSSSVTSPVVEKLGVLDMGDTKTLVDFVKWGVQKYPAKHYFVDVWNHGNGWHKIRRGTTRDISWDDISGNHITTAQLGLAAAEMATIIGHKVDLMGADACLMSMVEVTGEIANSVAAFVGSQEVEPGLGWPYDTFLAKWVANPTASNLTVGDLLAKDYQALYQGQEDGTLSVMDLTHQQEMEAAITSLATKLKGLNAADQKTLKTATSGVIHFYDSDYADLGDLIKKLNTSGIAALSTGELRNVESAMKSFVTSAYNTTSFANAMGVSIWWPTDKYTYQEYSDKYAGLKFISTGWGDVLKMLNP